MTPDAALKAYAGDAKRGPVEVARWWRALSEREQSALVLEHPESVGNLEGIDYVTHSAHHERLSPGQLDRGATTAHGDLRRQPRHDGLRLFPGPGHG